MCHTVKTKDFNRDSTIFRTETTKFINEYFDKKSDMVLISRLLNHFSNNNSINESANKMNITTDEKLPTEKNMDDEIINNISDNILIYGDHSIPYIIDHDNIVWFAAKEIVVAIGYTNTKAARQNAIRYNVPEVSRSRLKDININNKNGHPNTIYINDTGLFHLLEKSRFKTAELFKKWLYEEIKPSLKQNTIVKSP